MAIVLARVVKLRTDNGLVEFLAGVPIGRVYRIDPYTRRWQRMYNLEHRREHTAEIVDDEDGAWLPVECLEWEGKG